MIDHIENSLEVINIHLNSQRNRIINLSLLMEMLGVTCGIGAVIGGIFGMNMKNHIEEDQFAFYWVIAITIAIMSSMLGKFLNKMLMVKSIPNNLESNKTLFQFFCRNLTSKM